MASEREADIMDTFTPLLLLWVRRVARFSELYLR